MKFIAAYGGQHTGRLLNIIYQLLQIRKPLFFIQIVQAEPAKSCVSKTKISPNRFMYRPEMVSLRSLVGLKSGVIRQNIEHRAFEI